MSEISTVTDLRGDLRNAIRAAQRALLDFKSADAASDRADAALLAAADIASAGKPWNAVREKQNALWNGHAAALAAGNAVVYVANSIIIAEAGRLIGEAESLRAVLQYIATLPVDAEGTPNEAHARIVEFLAKAPPADGEYENHPAVTAWRAARDRLAVSHDADAPLPG